jgi:hypothetical protein
MIIELKLFQISNLELALNTIFSNYFIKYRFFSLSQLRDIQADFECLCATTSDNEARKRIMTNCFINGI